EVVETDAATFISADKSAWDFVFMDHGSSNYLSTFDLLRAKIEPRGVIIVDGWTDISRWDVEPYQVAYRRHIDQDPAFQSYLLPIEKGEMLSVRIPGFAS
ncbi:MAG: hypothetical protein ACXWO1_18465, partial [Isosphaeraceae bacterium]